MPHTHTRPAQRKAFSSSGKHTLSIFHPVFQTLSSSSLRPRKHPPSYSQTSQKPFLAVTCGVWFAFQSRAINPGMHDVKRAVSWDQNGHSGTEPAGPKQKPARRHRVQDLDVDSFLPKTTVSLGPFTFETGEWLSYETMVTGSCCSLHENTAC